MMALLKSQIIFNKKIVLIESEEKSKVFFNPTDKFVIPIKRTAFFYYIFKVNQLSMNYENKYPFI